MKECPNKDKLPVYSDGIGYLQCPNMKIKDGDTDMSGEHYKCNVCGRTVYIDYDEIR